MYIDTYTITIGIILGLIMALYYLKGNENNQSNFFDLFKVLINLLFTRKEENKYQNLSNVDSFYVREIDGYIDMDKKK